MVSRQVECWSDGVFLRCDTGHYTLKDESALAGMAKCFGGTGLAYNNGKGSAKVV